MSLVIGAQTKSGISHIENKVKFTRVALPGERVVASRTLSRAKYEEADIIEVIKSSPERIEPKCSVYGICGGCSFQHLSSPNQINAKHMVSFLFKMITNCLNFAWV